MSLALRILSILWIPAAFADTPEFHKPEFILDAVRKHIASNIRQPGADTHIEAQALDPRLQLPACSQDLETFSPPGQHFSGSVTVGVRCPGTKPWTIYTKAYVRAFETVLVLANPLKQGTVLGAADLRQEKREISSLRGGYLTAPEQALGGALRRSTAAGSVLGAEHLLTAKAIRRGQAVTLRALAGNLEIKAEGQALGDADLGQRVRVRNVQSGRVVEGAVEGSGLVRVRD
jgi:flagella basal body P-ring formation protein FlgA